MPRSFHLVLLLLAVVATMAAQPRRAATAAVPDPDAELRRLFEGKNFGKQLLKV